MNAIHADDASQATEKPPPRQSLASPTFFLATGAGVGLLGVAPGTLGCLWGIPLTLAISQIPSLAWQMVIILLLSAFGIPICSAAARRLGRKDPGAVVWDEIATLPVTFFLIPSHQLWSPWMLITGFALHRVLDISKPPPARQMEFLPEGWGIMLDDWIAGIYSCLTLHGLRWLGMFG